ncbi:glycosyltransferase family 2 protein [Trichothermofontia sp.]
MSLTTLNQTYIIIPVHNRKSTTLACLDNLQQIGDLDRYSVIIIDDGSTDGTSEAIQIQFPQVKILRGDGNLWWTGAIRMGMNYAIQQGAEYLIWLNDDCRISPGTLADLVQFCQEHPKTIVGCQGFEQDHPKQLSFGGKRKTWQGFRFMTIPPGQVVPCDLLSGNLVCLPATVVDAIGLPNPAETPHYGGDSLYLLRSQQVGFSLFVDSRHPVFNHSGEPSLNPRDWIMVPGDPWQIFRLALNPYSGLSWQLWLRLNWEAYWVWGILMFAKKYLSMLPITLLRCLPLNLRKRLFPHRAQKLFL